MEPKLITFVTVLLLVLSHQSLLASSTAIGVCYGTLGDNLPAPKDVIDMYQKNGIQFLRLYDPNPDILDALRGINTIAVSLGMKNEDLAKISSSQDAANEWVQTNVAPYKDDVSFKWVTAGNEVIPGPYAQYVPQAINNTWNALASIGLSGVKVTTAVSSNVLGSSYPPSSGAFSEDAMGVMKDISLFLYHTGGPLMINVYPYFAYTNDPAHISMDYAMFNSKEPVVVDGSYNYFNLFDAMVDAFNAALEKIDMSDVYIGISESGWPSAGNEPFTSKENARTYNTNFMKHILEGGTPRRPEHHMDSFMFAMFNENQKPAGVEQNFGFFLPNMEPVYPFW